MKKLLWMLAFVFAASAVMLGHPALVTPSVDEQLIAIFGPPKPLPQTVEPSEPETGAYVPPMGIPAPSFGIDEELPDAAAVAAKCPNWPATATIGCYYIDNSHGSATDSSNTYGRPNVPRMTIPLNVLYNAGNYIEIHGGGAAYSTAFRPRGLGTSSNPIWFVGVDDPVITASLSMGFANYPETAYMIFDGLAFDGVGADIRPRFPNNSIHHIAIRHGSFEGTGTASDSGGVSVGALAYSTATTADIVLWDLDIHGFGDPLAAAEEVGVYPVGYLENLWVLDSRIYDNAEDGIGGGHAAEYTAHHLYFGRNEIYNNLSNALDLKGVSHVVFSENTVWDHFDVWSGDCKTQYSSSQGEAIGVHYAGDSTMADSWDNHPTEVNLLFNTIYSQRFGITTSTQGVLRVIGNVVYNSRFAPTCFFNNVEGMLINGVVDDQWWVDNTIYGNDGGIRVTDGPAAYDASRAYYRGYRAVYNNATYVCYAAECESYLTGGAANTTGTAQSFTASSIVIDAAETYATNELIGATVVITSGAFSGTRVLVTANDGSTDTLTVDWPSTTPTGTPTYAIYIGTKGIDPSNTDFWRPFRLRITGNISANRAESDQGELDWDSAAFADDSQDVDRNLFYSPLGEAIFYGNGTQRTLQWIKDNTIHCTNCLSDDPLFTSPGISGSADFTLQAGSPAIGANTESSAYDSFEAVYGISIKFDRNGVARPQCGTWDIGAYERTSC